jgi:hypothetical protein
MRRPRIKAEGTGYYHCMSRIIERRYILGDAEKERLLELMRNLAAFGGLDILSYRHSSYGAAMGGCKQARAGFAPANGNCTTSAIGKCTTLKAV